MTITSACNHELQMNRMVKNSIALEPLFGCRKDINQSKVAMEWLCWEEHSLQTQACMDMAEEDREAYDLMELAYVDGDHPLYETHIH